MVLDLPLIWALLIAFAVFAYVVLDGFDLGVGILFAGVRDRRDRDLMVNAIAPVWDGNETWLVLGGGGLFAVFPLAYATLLPALYMPLVVMLLALVFRGVAFEMRFRATTDRGRLRWDRSFQWGSSVAAFCQGVALGGFVQGIRVTGRSYAGGWWDWLSAFSLLTGAALVIGYALLGACWLVRKTDGDIQAHFRAAAARLARATVGAMAAVSGTMLLSSAPFREQWLALPTGFGAGVIAGLTVLTLRRLLVTLRAGADLQPFICALMLFVLSYVGLGVSEWPLVVPPSITIRQAAGPPASQSFLLIGAAFMIPIILIYTGLVYRLFWGKVSRDAGYH